MEIGPGGPGRSMVYDAKVDKIILFGGDNAGGIYGQTWAYGILKQYGIGTSSIKTHVDIQVFNPDGSIQYETITDELFVPRNRVGKGPDWKRFRVQIPNKLPKDSQINMTVHSGSHEKSDAKS